MAMLLNVQMLRAIAAFLVVFVHLAKLAGMAGLPDGWTYFGNSGVDLFFVISGMIMVMTTAGGRQTPLGFLRNRFTRIAPLYWTITFAVFAVALAAPRLMQSTTADPIHLLKSLAFIPSARGDGQMHPTVFVGWTLNYEMMFYVLFALGMMLPGRWLGLAATGALLVAAVVAGQLLRPQNPVAQFYLQPVILEFGAGMALGAFLRLLALVIMLAGGWIWPQFDRAFIFGVPAVVAVACAVVAERCGLAARQGWVQLLGAASYAVYLTHFFCTQAVVKAAERLHAGPILALVLAILAFLLVAMVGVAAHLWIELPLTERARRLLATRRAPQPARADAPGSDGHVVDEPRPAEDGGGENPRATRHRPRPQPRQVFGAAHLYIVDPAEAGGGQRRDRFGFDLRHGRTGVQARNRRL
jgi:peptidoglycan/LPS O-acetylase OafA/YrhL